MISLSNLNWAYADIGNPGNTIFSWSYFIIPFLIVICLLYTIFSKPLKKQTDIVTWFLLLIFGWSFFTNYPRGLVRHSLAESSTTVVIWCGYLFLALFISCYKDNRKLFLPIFMILILCDTLFVQDKNFEALPIADVAASKPGSIIESWKPARFSKEDSDDYSMTYWEQLKYSQEVVNRVKLDTELQEYVDQYNAILDILLDKEETYVDFINKTLIYSLTGRKNPAYISQSPLQLSGEYTQMEFIKEIAEVPLILMPVDADNYLGSNSLDNITNVYRNYKVAEYIYQNYIPLCKCNSYYAIWCLKDKHEKYMQKITVLNMEAANKANAKNVIPLLEYIDYGYDGPMENLEKNEEASYIYLGALHNHSIGWLPEIWANSDKKDSVTNFVLTELVYDKGIFTFDQETLKQSTIGNYLKIMAVYDGTDTDGFYEKDDEQLAGTVILGVYNDNKFVEKYRYSMLFKEGQHNYLIRCSTDYYWYTGDINAVKVLSDGSLHIQNIQILEGD